MTVNLLPRHLLFRAVPTAAVAAINKFMVNRPSDMLASVDATHQLFSSQLG